MLCRVLVSASRQPTVTATVPKFFPPALDRRFPNNKNFETQSHSHLSYRTTQRLQWRDFSTRRTGNDETEAGRHPEADRHINSDAETEGGDTLRSPPLPDLTKGIPSTLDEELRQARSRRGGSHSSLNITEHPDQPLPPGGGGGAGTAGYGGDGLPRNAYISSSERKKNALIKYTYLSLAGALVGWTLYLGRNWDSEAEEKQHADAPSGWGLGLFWARAKARMASTLSYYNEPAFPKLLPDEEADPALRPPFTLVLSLEDLLVHQEWTRETGWRIAKRPGLDYFLRYLSQYYELVVFTSQPSHIGDSILRKLDPYRIIRWPLYREATLYKNGEYVKVRGICFAAYSRISLTSDIKD